MADVMDNAAWEALLAKEQAGYEQAEEFGSKFIPPVGTYTCIIKGVRTGVLKAVSKPYWAVMGTLLDGIDPETNESLEGKEFQIGYFTTKNEVAEGILKGFAAKLAGHSVPQLLDASRLITGSVGMVLKVEAVTSKDGLYTNIRVKEVIQTEAAEAPSA